MNHAPKLISRCTVALLLFLLAQSGPLPAAERNMLYRALESIEVDRLNDLVVTLADDTFEGREAGSRGGRAAGTYLIRELKKIGVAGGGVDGAYHQPFGNDYRNILAVLPGSDPKLKDEYIVIGAHYDHVGYGTHRNSYGPIGFIHNGADDNASGTAALLEIAEALMTLPEPPRRSVLFGLWDGEEKGLLGSKHWVGHPTVPLEQIKFVINMDMVGRLGEKGLQVMGTRSGPGLRQMICRENREVGVQLQFPWKIRDNTDHSPFFEQGIPVLSLHTGLHDDYHRPSDDAELINVEGIQEVARLAFHVAHTVAERDTEIDFRPDSRSENAVYRKRFEQTLENRKPRLGISWDRDADATQGIRLMEIRPGSPAARAGLTVGDRMTQFDGRSISSQAQLVQLVLAASATVPVLVDRSGSEEPVTVEIELDGKPIRLGLSWREDEGEPGSVTVIHVVAGSPAYHGGLKTRDRVYEVNGKPFQDSDAFRKMVTTLDMPMNLLVERHGLLEQVTLQPLDSVERVARRE
jgi:hypothetical protein